MPQTHTAEEVRDLAKQGTDALQTFINGQHALHVPPRDTDPDIVWAKCLSIVDAYAADLERREAGVTEEVVGRCYDEFLLRIDPEAFHVLSKKPQLAKYAMRAALRAVRPVAAEPAQPTDSGRARGGAFASLDALESIVLAVYDRTSMIGAYLAHVATVRAALAAQGQPAERDEIAEEAWRAFYRADDKVQKESQSNG